MKVLVALIFGFWACLITVKPGKVKCPDERKLRAIISLEESVKLNNKLLQDSANKPIRWKK